MGAIEGSPGMWGDDVVMTSAAPEMALNRAKALCARLEASWSLDPSAQSPGETATGGLGVYLSGTVVADFLPGSTAASGLQKGDKIVKVNVCDLMLASSWHRKCRFRLNY